MHAHNLFQLFSSLSSLLYFHVFSQGLISFLVNENGFNVDRVTKVCILRFALS